MRYMPQHQMLVSRSKVRLSAQVSWEAMSCQTYLSRHTRKYRVEEPANYKAIGFEW